MVTFKNIYKSFGKIPVLEGINLNFEMGKITAILGPNGSGKTTIIKCILGMVRPNSGNILVNEKVIGNDAEYRKGIDYLPQIARFPENLTVLELLNMIVDIRNQPSHHETLVELFNLTKYKNENLGNLSGGTKQKVNLILTFMFDNPIIILDEPTSGLDPVSLITLKDLIIEERRKGKMIILTTHISNLVEELADDIIFLLEGKIYFQGTPTHLINQQNGKNLEEAIANLIMGRNV